MWCGHIVILLGKEVRIGAISRKALRRGVTHTAFDIEEIIDSADRKLFIRITQPGHCLYHLSPKTSA